MADLLYEKLKKENPCTFIAEQQGSFYRTYGDAAYILHGLLGFKLNISEDGVVHAGFPIEHPERALMALKDNKISFKFFRGEENVEEKDFGEDNQYAEMVLMYSGKDTPKRPEKKKDIYEGSDFPGLRQGNDRQPPAPETAAGRQYASIMEGLGDDVTKAMNDLMARIEKNILSKGMRVEAMTTVLEERNGAIKVMGIVFHNIR